MVIGLASPAPWRDAMSGRMHPAVAAATPNWALLGGVRFALAMIVASTHWPLAGKESDPFFALSVFGGLASVLGFLAISGVSIAHSYAHEPRQFFVRRFARIYPCYVFCLLAWWCFFPLTGLSALTPAAGVRIAAPTLWQTVQNAFMLQGATAAPAFDPAWSLSVECWFYAATPLLVLCRPSVVRLLALASAAIYFFIASLALTTLVSLQSCLPAVVVGWAWLLGFVLYQSNMQWLDAAILAAAGTVLLWHYTGDYQPLSIVTYLGVCAALLLGPRIALGPRASRVLNYLGELSYPLYLVHVPVLCVCAGYLHIHRPLVLAVAPLLLAVAMVHGIDRPLRSRLGRIEARIDPARAAGWMLIALACCATAGLAMFTQVAALWLVGASVTGCLVLSHAMRRGRLRRCCMTGGVAGCLAALACATFPQWTTYQFGGPLPPSVALQDPAAGRVAHGFQDDWVVGRHADIYLAAPAPVSAVALRITASIPHYLAGQVVHVSAGGCKLGTFVPAFSAASARFILPAACRRGARAAIRLAMEKAVPPPGTLDTRRLSLRVEEVALDAGP